MHILLCLKHAFQPKSEWCWDHSTARKLLNQRKTWLLWRRNLAMQEENCELIYIYIYIFIYIYTYFLLQLSFFRWKSPAEQNKAFKFILSLSHCSSHQCKPFNRAKHVTLLDIIGGTFWCSIFKTSHCNSSEDPAPVDEIYGCLIFRWVAETSLYDNVPV